MGFLAFLAWVFFMVLTAIKARDYGRSALLWVIVGLVLSPLVSILGLLILGNTKGKANG